MITNFARCPMCRKIFLRSSRHYYYCSNSCNFSAIEKANKKAKIQAGGVATPEKISADLMRWYVVNKIKEYEGEAIPPHSKEK